MCYSLTGPSVISSETVELNATDNNWRPDQFYKLKLVYAEFSEIFTSLDALILFCLFLLSLFAFHFFILRDNFYIYYVFIPH